MDDCPSLEKAHWDSECQRTCEASGEAYIEPAVHMDDFWATTLKDVDYFPDIHPVKMPAAERLTAWKSCQAESMKLLQEIVTFSPSREGIMDWGYSGSSVCIMDISRGHDLECFLAIIISVPSNRGPKSEWRTLLASIGKLLYAKDCRELKVLISAPDPQREIRYFPVESYDPLVRLWPKLTNPILRILGQIDWNLVGIVNVRDGERSSTVPTILIGTKNAKDPQWSSITSEIKSICHEFGAGNLQIMIYRVLSPRPLKQESYHHELRMGQSIGVDQNEPGTLGGHVRLVFPDGHVETLGLTSHQAVRPGPTNSEISPSSLAVNAPSLLDHIKRYITLQENIESNAKSLNSSKVAIDAGQATPSRERWYENSLRDKARIDNEFSEWCAVHHLSVAEFKDAVADPTVDAKEWISAHQHDLLCGRVKYYSNVSSTLSSSEGLGHRLDWALIEPISGGRTPELNTLPLESDLTESFYLHGKTRVEIFCDDDELKGGMSYFPLCKTGRTTGLTIGEYNSIRPLANLKNSQGGKHAITQEHCMIVGRPRHYNDIVFSRGGDSGAWIINNRGRLVGMLWEDSTVPEMFSLFTTIDVILEDIKLRTGCERVELL